MVMPLPGVNDLPGLCQRDEPVLVQTTGDAVPADHLGRRNVCLAFLQYSDDLFFCITFTFHFETSLGPILEEISLFGTGFLFGGQIKATTIKSLVVRQQSSKQKLQMVFGSSVPTFLPKVNMFGNP